MIARPFIAERAVDHDEVRRRLHRKNLTCGRHADEKLAPRGKELFRDQDGECRADGATDDAVLEPLVIKSVEIGVITRLSRMPTSPSCRKQVADDVAVRIEDAQLRNGIDRKTLLSARLAQ